MLPCKLFSERSKVERKEKFPNVAGITPEKLFFAKLIYCIGGDIMEDDGMIPENSLSERSNVTSDVLLKRVEGMFPLSLFCMRSSGRPPVKLLFRRKTMASDGLLPKDSGILLTRLLLGRNRYCNFGSNPIPKGILPPRLLLLRTIC
ncbi:hypothetical protein PVAP13_8KG059624 [Panicum virgatum]|uniref:Uncharacterized protein n=1 Tax=Panicum virgatum TaxID=38727 RepID=A0A8T0PMZ8_PANVG|nr:hypothetical protein PVAP13_8KG059624 [Panicum virgatum]